jgi:hypothetical protein
MVVDLITSARTSLLWFDAHLDRTALALLVDALETGELKRVRLLSVGYAAATAGTIDDYKRVRSDFKQRDIAIEWRTLADHQDANKHDRWLLVDSKLWNLPPIDQILRAGKYGSIVPDSNSVPLEDWWELGTDLEVALSSIGQRRN